MNFKEFQSKAKNYIFCLKRARMFKQKTDRQYDGRILYFDPALHLNLGDQAQKYCIREWIKENYQNYQVLEIPGRLVLESRFSFLKELKKNVKRDDIIVFQSGYCTHDLGPGRQDLIHRIIISTFPDNRILMLPQTVYFQHEDRKVLSSQEYSKANRMLFLARDQVSYKIAKEMLPNTPVYAYPDIVTTLIGTRKFDEKRDGIFLCTRQDSEKYYSDEELAELVRKLSAHSRVDKGDTSVEDCDPYWLDENIGVKLEEVFRKYASYKVIITDRYHGTIFSLIAGTPVVVIKTTDHKVSTGVDWFKGIYDYAYYTETLDEAYEKVVSLLKDEKPYIPEPYFKKEYYDKLKDLFDKCAG